MGTIKEKTAFYFWAKNKGINLVDLEVERLNFEDPKQENTFKNRSNEIKVKYNHVFKYPLEYHMRGIATLERFILERK